MLLSNIYKSRTMIPSYHNNTDMEYITMVTRAELITGLEKSFRCQSQNFLWWHFSGRIFFHLGCNRAPRLESLGAKNRSYLWGHLLHTSGHEHHQWNDSKFLFFFANENRWKAKKKRKEERKEKETTRKKLGPLHSQWTLRGRDKSCWIKADKSLHVEPNLKKGKMCLLGTTTCTMLESAVLTWTWACCASNCTLLVALPCFFRSRYVRDATLLSISQVRKWPPWLWSLKNRSRPWFLRT